MGISSWFHDNFTDPLLLVLRGGADPKHLSLSAALGFTLGVFPICGVTIFLCGMAIALLGPLCDAPTVLLSNFIATPIELSLVVPFLRCGEVITAGPHFPLTSDALKKILSGQASQEVLLSVAHAKFNSPPLSETEPLQPHPEVVFKVRDV
ncbi:PREDICTED: uncharacterized protein LOC109325798 isoform X2 [Lupinus angustifolius]|uniref:uncharacterized protein LOC109325798 isoform X2 n=1 Tax=Lupinus angustifolius TaxID=3871 RepID=UPI00092EBDBD|nr:PREDICTED: uncharacterized protein LOC109325798 isoform X2 [Lupinus angustifolius]